MSRIWNAIDNMERTHKRFDNQFFKKTKNKFSFSTLMEVFANNKAKEKLRMAEIDGVTYSIIEPDLDRLQALVTKNSPKKNEFLDSLYEKYKVNRKTHRICVLDGAIERILE